MLKEKDTIALCVHVKHYAQKKKKPKNKKQTKKNRGGGDLGEENIPSKQCGFLGSGFAFSPTPSSSSFFLLYTFLYFPNFLQREYIIFPIWKRMYI